MKRLNMTHMIGEALASRSRRYGLNLAGTTRFMLIGYFYGKDDAMMASQLAEITDAEFNEARDYARARLLGFGQDLFTEVHHEEG